MRFISIFCVILPLITTSFSILLQDQNLSLPHLQARAFSTGRHLNPCYGGNSCGPDRSYIDALKNDIANGKNETEYYTGGG